MIAENYLLLAEDDEGIVEILRHALAEENYPIKMIHVHDGAEALDFLYARDKFQGRASCNPNVLLLDLKMPKVDGLEVLRQVKGDKRLKTMPVVMLTSSKNDSDVQQSYELGANSYVTKPVDFFHFITVMKQLVAFWMTINQPPLPIDGQMTDAPLKTGKG